MQINFAKQSSIKAIVNRIFHFFLHSNMNFILSDKRSEKKIYIQNNDKITEKRDKNYVIKCCTSCKTNEFI